MLKTTRVDFAPGVVTRLRFVFATIAAIVFCVTAISVDRLYELNNSVRNLTISSVDVFVKVEDAERSLKNLILLLQQVNNATTTAELAERGSDLSGTLSLLRGKMSELRQFQQTQEMSDEMARALQQTEIVANLIFQANMDVLGRETNLATLEQELRTARDTVGHILEDELFHSNQFRGPDATNDSGVADTSITAAQQSYSQELLRANAITSIGLEFDAILGGMSSLRTASDLDDVRAIETEIRLKLRSITTLLTQIEDDTARSTLALNLVAVRNNLIGDAGALHEMQRLLALQLELESFKSSQLAETAVISSLSARLIGNARGAIDRANVDVSVKTTQMIWILGLAGFAVLLVIATATWVVVERQINRRMSKLTHAVLALAGGEKNVNVDVQGFDELGKMAASLDVFKANADELVRSNSELEKFAYIAAHDLRSPLRAISDLADWIVHDEDNMLSDSSVEMMALLDNRVDRLSKLLADLLEYSIVGTETDALGAVGLQDVVQEIADMLNHDQKFMISYLGDVDTVTTFATPLRQILQNLLNNGMKHHDRETGHIQVAAQIVGGRLRCSVADDGPGIEPKYQKKMFGLFQTLKPRDEVEGSGLGLAIIQKLVEHYGGTVTVTSNPQSRRGATFEFDMPIDTTQISHRPRAA